MPRWLTDRAFLFLMPPFLYLMTLHNGADYYFQQRAGVMFAVFGLIAIGVGRIYGPLVGLLSGYIGFSAVNAVFVLDNQFAPLGQIRPFLQRGILLGAFSTLTIIAAVWLKPIPRRLMARLFTAFGILLCAHFWVFSHFFNPEGYLMTPTMAGVYLALCLPLAPHWGIAGLFALTILGTGGHSCGLGLAAYLLGVIWVRRPKLTLPLLASLGATGALVWAIRGTAWVFRDHGRSKNWAAALNWWWGSGHRWEGLGAGSWYSLFPSIQKTQGILDHGIYGMTYPHNEPVGYLFELGLIGFGIMLTFWFVAVTRSKAVGDAKSVGFLMALAATSISMMPLRLEATLFLSMFLMYDVLENSFRRGRI